MKQGGKQWLVPLMVGALVVYTLWSIGEMRRELMWAADYRQELIRKTESVAAENERLEREIAQASDPAVMERMARARLGLVYPGEQIFCGIP